MYLILLQVVSLVYIVLLNLFYFSKKHLNSIENNIYKYLLLSNAVGLIIELLCFYSVTHMEMIPLFNSFVTKLLLVYYLWFIALYTYYVFVIAYKDKENNKFNKNLKRIKTCDFIGFVISSAIVSYLPMYYYN